MTYGQDPMMLAKKGNSWNPSQNTGLDENLVRAIAQYLSQGGRLRDAGTMTPNLMGGMEQGAAEQGYEQDAARSRAQAGMMQDGSPNALTGGRTSGFADAVAEGDPNSELYRMYVGEPQGPQQPPMGQALADVRRYGPEIYEPQSNPQPSYSDYGASLVDVLGSMGQGQTPEAIQSGGGVAGTVGRAADLAGNFWNKALGTAQEKLDESKKPMKPKKKGELSDFFKVLKAAKSGDKTTKKSLKDLASQLEASGGEVPVS